MVLCLPTHLCRGDEGKVRAFIKGVSKRWMRAQGADKDNLGKACALLRQVCWCWDEPSRRCFEAAADSGWVLRCVR